VAFCCGCLAGDIFALYEAARGPAQAGARLSPNKTWEGGAGFAGGQLTGRWSLLGLEHLFTTSGTRLWLSFRRISGIGMGLAVLVNVAAQVAIWLSRRSMRCGGVKDSGSCCPGHGGVLDRIDALPLCRSGAVYALVIQQRF